MQSYVYSMMMMTFLPAQREWTGTFWGLFSSSKQAKRPFSRRWWWKPCTIDLCCVIVVVSKKWIQIL